MMGMIENRNVPVGNPRTSGGWGECGVFINSRANYHKIVGVGELASVVIPICNKYKVVVPSFEIRPTKKRLWGKAYVTKNMIAFYLPIRLGCIYHELAHHIAWSLYKDRGHNSTFKWILQRILYDNHI